MRIDKLRLKNFRAYEDLEMEFHPNFNIVIGSNGTGKTAILEALTVAIGSFFLGVDYAETRHIRPEDIRVLNSEYDINEQFPVEIEAWGELNGQPLQWKRELTGPKNKTTYVNAMNIKQVAKEMQDQIRAGENIDLPVIAYYSTERLWKERPDTTTLSSSRLQDGYYNGLKATSNNKFFTKWFEKEEMVVLQQKKDSAGLYVVRKTVSNCIDDCENLYFDYNRKELVMELRDGRKLPFRYLSDGVRNMLAMVADIAFRCAILNPHLRDEAAEKAHGVVLVDELDLHLHPSWQKRVVRSLKESFPNVQFIVTTHSPLILSSVQDRIITIREGKSYYPTNIYGRTATKYCAMPWILPSAWKASRKCWTNISS
ncbi:MAG: AAA family ATPase [Microscillaceae bacterium]|nr:AAA family ATPase [Microscillaceae bacterium]